MQINTKSLHVLLPSLLLFLFVGCASPRRQPNGATPGSPAVKKFQGPNLQGRTAVESAIELSQKYAELSDQVAALREKNQSLDAENTHLKEQVASLESKLKQTQKELTEANELLVDMLGELNTWRSNILGFRNEMRDAAKAQLEALLKVLELLGGQTTAPPPATQKQTTPTETLPPQPQIQQTPSPGEPNA